MSRYHLLELPEELVVEILKYLEVKTLLLCRQVAHPLSSVARVKLTGYMSTRSALG